MIQCIVCCGSGRVLDRTLTRTAGVRSYVDCICAASVRSHRRLLEIHASASRTLRRLILAEKAGRRWAISGWEVAHVRRMRMFNEAQSGNARAL